MNCLAYCSGVLYVFTDPVSGSGNGASLDLEEELKSVKEDLKAPEE